MSRALRCRPSQLYNLTDPFVAYCFDAAVSRWALMFEEAVTEATSRAKDQDAARQAERRVVRKWLKLPASWGRKQG
jgi:hypothetical protein